MKSDNVIMDMFNSINAIAFKNKVTYRPKFIIVNKLVPRFQIETITFRMCSNEILSNF